ncbi:helix-turn-helix domain-containing protein [Nostoc sp. UHCC 0870]|uniref:helix-turn-helix domain-containing protein n=1 Tax=Nostoc sp. UHCC 0870 TaxID=2914041 RepID=UPI001EDCF36D|nr:helix-turn-helix domain-containing protein [Nostoc sp. UHCC 0870]UKO98078.1 helix-turn-helix domain-containing protein [Nostoc sp. UHCC 0870]
MTAIVPGKTLSIEKFADQESEAKSIKELDCILQEVGSHLKLIGANGEEIIIPDAVCQVLHEVVHAIASEQAISIVPQKKELTTQQAADFLNVSRPYLIKLLEQGDIPYIKVGTHRRVRFDDLMKYKQERDTKRRQLLDELIAESQELGFYE